MMKDDVLSNTKSRLIDLMKCDGEITVEQGAEALDLASTTIRQHLGVLEEQGFVKTRPERYGRGRPLKMYSLTDKSEVWYENRDPELLGALIQFLSTHGESALLDEFFEGLIDEFQRLFENFASSREGSRLELLCTFMQKYGFIPDCVSSEDGLHIGLCHCPFQRATEVTGLVCQAEKKFLENVLGRELVRVSHIASGDVVCGYRAKASSESE